MSDHGGVPPDATTYHRGRKPTVLYGLLMTPGPGGRFSKATQPHYETNEGLQRLQHQGCQTGLSPPGPPVNQVSILKLHRTFIAKVVRLVSKEEGQPHFETSLYVLAVH